MNCSRYVQKKWCPAHTCADNCPATEGCLRGGDTHTVGVTCYNNQYETVPYISTTFDVVVNSADGPSFYYDDGASTAISHDSVGVGSVINTIVPSLADDGYDWDYVRYRQDRGPGVSYLHQTADLFALDTSNGQVKVMKSLAFEFDYYFDMNLCVYDRRGEKAVTFSTSLCGRVTRHQTVQTKKSGVYTTLMEPTQVMVVVRTSCLIQFIPSLMDIFLTLTRLGIN